MENSGTVADLKPWDLALKIHEINEVGSQEFESSKLLMSLLEAHGFKVTGNFLDISTAFKAEKTIGKGSHTVAFLAEYDALPGIGHACGHNLIASSAVFSAIRASEIVKDGKIIVFGTPDEEGTGEYSGSKILMANKGVFKDIDLVLGSHPSNKWSVGSRSLAVQDFEVTFKGTASHEAANPELGRSALDASILTYTAVNMMRQHVRRNANFVMHGIIKEGGTASNVTPEKSVLVYGIRTSDMDYHAELVQRFKDIVEGCAKATGTTYEFRNIGPLFSTNRINPTLSNQVRDFLVAKGVDCPTLETTYSRLPGGSTDFANVSQQAPSLEVGFQIAPEGTPWHSRQSLEAAKSDRAREMLSLMIDVLSQTAKKFTEDEKFRAGIKEDFRKK